MRTARKVLSATLALGVLAVATPCLAQDAPVAGLPAASPPPHATLPSLADDIGGDTQPTPSRSRLYPMMQVVGGSLFALSYGSTLVGAMMIPGPGVDADTERMASYLLIPVVGPFIASAQPNAPWAVTVSSGVVQVAGVATLCWGLIGGALDDEPVAHDIALTILPLSPDGTMPGIGLAGHY